LSYISQAILDHNAESSHDDQILFSKLVLANPLVDPETERMH